MERRISELMEEARKKIIVAMDVDDLFTAQKLARLLAPHVGMFKVGKQLFTACGPDVVRMIMDQGGEVFLDLKYHDIPNTTAMAGLEAAKLGVKLFNLHALGGPDMMKKVMEVLTARYPDPETRAKVLAVTILTSSTEETLQAVGINYPVANMVSSLAMLAEQCGINGVVCSTQEIKMIRAACGPDFLIVAPGVRLLGGNVDDQKRIGTPGGAVAAGADYIVAGRPIIEQPDPVVAAQAFAVDIATAMVAN